MIAVFRADHMEKRKVGFWLIDGGIELYMTKAPTRFQEWFFERLLGWKWYDSVANPEAKS